MSRRLCTVNFGCFCKLVGWGVRGRGWRSVIDGRGEIYADALEAIRNILSL